MRQDHVGGVLRFRRKSTTTTTTTTTTNTTTQNYYFFYCYCYYYCYYYYSSSSQAHGRTGIRAHTDNVTSETLSRKSPSHMELLKRAAQQAQATGNCMDVLMKFSRILSRKVVSFPTREISE